MPAMEPVGSPSGSAVAILCTDEGKLSLSVVATSGATQPLYKDLRRASHGSRQ